MINISYDLEDLIISAEGHAGYGAYGSDIVCAAVSTLMHSLAAYLSENEFYLEETAQIETIGGFMVIKCCPERERKREVRAVYELCVLGLSCIAEQYPKHVKLFGNII